MTEGISDTVFAPDFSSWIRAEIGHQDYLVSLGRVVETARGPVEYAQFGSGPAVLCIHGGPGGFDQGLLLFEWLAKAGFTIIAPSRPGYLNTPLSGGKTPAEQADLYAALLDTLKIDKVALIFGSAGGPSGYEFAIRYPSRTTALVAADAVVSDYLVPANAGPLTEALFLSGPGERIISFFSKHFPKSVIHEFLHQESMLKPDQIERQVESVLQDPFQMSLFLRFSRSMSDYPKRKPGVENDLDTLSRIGDLPVGSIRSPALIIHGTHDSDVLFYHGVYAWENIPGAEKIWVREGSHLCAWISPQVHDTHARIVAFLQLNQ